MPMKGPSQPVRGRLLRTATVVGALALLVGASPNPFPQLAKADRIPSPADCREERTESIDCLGIVLPHTAGEIIEVAPGLSLVGQIPG